MEKTAHFSETVVARLQHYVYRLIDPRTGTTFYVGRGQGDRVFSHAAGQQKATAAQDSEELKLKTIRKIMNAGFDVQHVVHRHGLSEETAREVESALIDAYPGLTNLQAGFDSDRGAMHAEEVIRAYEAPGAVFKHRVLLINVNKSSEDLDLYDAVRFAWKISPSKARACDYVLAVRRGLIIGVFKADEWLPATTQNFPSFPTFPNACKRFGFNGCEAPSDVKALYLQRRVPDGYRRRGASNPIRYV
jgi:hypothetical protein